MTNVREITTTWTLPSGVTTKSVMYFETVPAVSVQRSALGAFWTAIKAGQASTVNYAIDITGREMDTATGTLTGTWSENTGYTGTGSGGSVAVPDVAQILLQWRTASIINGRFLRGRTFIPGASTGSVSNGNVVSTTVIPYTSAMANFIASAAKFSVWHRPIAGSGGGLVLATVGTVWPEFAYLRKRRG